MLANVRMQHVLICECAWLYYSVRMPCVCVCLCVCVCVCVRACLPPADRRCLLCAPGEGDDRYRAAGLRLRTVPGEDGGGDQECHPADPGGSPALHPR